MASPPALSHMFAAGTSPILGGGGAIAQAIAAERTGLTNRGHGRRAPLPDGKTAQEAEAERARGRQRAAVVAGMLDTQVEAKQHRRVEERCEELLVGEQLSWEVLELRRAARARKDHARVGRRQLAAQQRQQALRERALACDRLAKERALDSIEQLQPAEALHRLDAAGAQDDGTGDGGAGAGAISPRHAQQLHMQRKGMAAALRARLRAAKDEALAASKAQALAQAVASSQRQAATEKSEARSAARLAVQREGEAMRAEASQAADRVERASVLGSWRRRQQDRFLLLQAEQRRVAAERERLEEQEEELLLLRRKPRVGQLMKFDSEEQAWNPKPVGGSSAGAGASAGTTAQGVLNPPWWVEQDSAQAAPFYGQQMPSDAQKLIGSGGGLALSHHARPRVKWYD